MKRGKIKNGISKKERLGERQRSSLFTEVYIKKLKMKEYSDDQ